MINSTIILKSFERDHAIWNLTDQARQSSGAANGSVHAQNIWFSKESTLAGKVFLCLLQPIAKILETLYLILP